MTERERKDRILVIGMGSTAFGRERRAVSAFKQMERVEPHFLITQWEDGTVSRLLQRNNLSFSYASLGYVGFDNLLWTLDNIIRWPLLYGVVIGTYLRKSCRSVVVLDVTSLLNVTPALLVLKYFLGARLIFYLGDIPRNTRFHRFLASVVNRLADEIIANSQAVKRGLVGLGIEAQRIRVIYNGVNTEEFTEASPFGLRRIHGWSSDTFLIGYLGQIRANKGVSDFVEAARLVMSRGVNCRFVIVGGTKAWDNDEERNLKKQISDSDLERYLVLVERLDEVEQVYRELDVAVVPSRHQDPAPNVNLEAMASGIPVIATRVGGTPEMVHDKETGFLVEPRAPEQIASRLLELIRDPGLREKMGEGGKERVKKEFDIRKTAAAVENLILNNGIETT